MPDFLHLLMLFCLFSGTTPIPAIGIKGGNVTLTCEHKATNIAQIELFSRSGDIDVCQDEECSVRVFKEGDCDVVIKNLRFSDAGKYYLHVYYTNDQTELERQIRTYQICVDDEISVSIGEQLELDVLLSEADKVQHQSRRSTEWKEDWSRSDGVQSERITIRNRNLIISNFTARDAGSYRVLDSDGDLLITVKVRVSSTASAKSGSKGKLNNTNDDNPNDTEKHNEISVKTDEELKLDVLLSEADKVQHQSNIRTEWKEVWSRSDGVQSERITIRDRNLIINEFMYSDTGSYRVLDSEGNILITVTVRVPSRLPVELRIVPVALLVFVVLILVAVKRRKILRCQNICCL